MDDTDLTPGQRRLLLKAMKAAHAKGRAAGEAAAERRLDAMLARFLTLKQLNGTGPTAAAAWHEEVVAKAEPPPPPEPAPEPDADPHHAVGLALLDHAVEALEAGEDPGPGVAALRALLGDPAELARVLGEGGADDATVGKCFRVLKAAAHAPAGGVSIQGKDYRGGQFIPAEVMANATPEEKAKVEGKDRPKSKKQQAREGAAQRRITREQARKKTADLVAHLKKVGDLKAELTPEHLYDLADHIAAGHMTVADLRAARAALSGTANRAGFGGARTKEGMARALAEHARKAGLAARLKEQGLTGDAAAEVMAAAGPKDATRPIGQSFPDPLDITPDNVQPVWEKMRDEIARHDPKMSAAQAGSIAAARILNNVGRRAGEFIDEIDARVRAGGGVTQEEDDRYIGAQDARRNLHAKLADLSGYRPHQTLDEHPFAQRPFDAPPLEDVAGKAAATRQEHERRAADVASSVAARRAGLTPVQGRIEWDGSAVEDPAGGKTVYRDSDGNLHATIAEHRRKQQALTAKQREESDAKTAAAAADGSRAEASRRQAMANAETVSRHFDRRLRDELRAAGHGQLGRRVKYALGGSRLPDDAPKEAVEIRNRLVAEYGRAQEAAGGLSAHPDAINSALANLTGASGISPRASDADRIAAELDPAAQARLASDARRADAAPTPVPPPAGREPTLEELETGVRPGGGRRARQDPHSPARGDRFAGGPTPDPAAPESMKTRPPLSGRAKEDYEDYVAVAVKQVGQEVSPRNKVRALNSVIHGIHPAAATGIVAEVLGAHPDIRDTLEALPPHHPTRQAFDAANRDPATPAKPAPAGKPAAAVPVLDAAASQDTHASVDRKAYPTRAAAEAVARAHPGGAVVRVGRKWMAVAPYAPAPATGGHGSVSGLDTAAFAKKVQAAVDASRTGWFGGNKVFISHAHEALRAEDPSLDRETFHAKLNAARQAGHLTLSRADLVQLMHPDDVSASELAHPGVPGAVAHFVLASPGAKPGQAARPYPAGRPKSPPNPSTGVDSGAAAGDTTPTPASETGGTTGGGAMGTGTKDEARRIRDAAISHETGGPEMSPEQLAQARGHVRGLLERAKAATEARGGLPDRVAKRFEAAMAAADALTPAFFYDGELGSDPTGEFPTLGGQNLVHVLARVAAAGDTAPTPASETGGTTGGGAMGTGTRPPGEAGVGDSVVREIRGQRSAGTVRAAKSGTLRTPNGPVTVHLEWVRGDSTAHTPAASDEYKDNTAEHAVIVHSTDPRTGRPVANAKTFQAGQQAAARKFYEEQAARLQGGQP